jgi:hypothetical protein
MSGTWGLAPRLARLRERWEARGKRRVCLGLHHLGLLKPLSQLRRGQCQAAVVRAHLAAWIRAVSTSGHAGLLRRLCAGQELRRGMLGRDAGLPPLPEGCSRREFGAALMARFFHEPAGEPWLTAAESVAADLLGISRAGHLARFLKKSRVSQAIQTKRGGPHAPQPLVPTKQAGKDEGVSQVLYSGRPRVSDAPSEAGRPRSRSCVHVNLSASPSQQRAQCDHGEGSSDPEESFHEAVLD